MEVNPFFVPSILWIINWSIELLPAMGVNFKKDESTLKGETPSGPAW